MKSLKTIMAAGLLTATGFSDMASAHDYGGALGKAATATDRFYIVCAAGSATMKFQVRRNLGTGNIKLCGLKTGACSEANTTKTTASKVFSPVKTVSAGAGAYFFTLNKKGFPNPNAFSYTVRAHCYDSKGVHNPDDQLTAVTYIKNQ